MLWPELKALELPHPQCGTSVCSLLQPRFLSHGLLLVQVSLLAPLPAW